MYKIIGANQVEYGPVTADQMRAWIAEGRVNAQTAVQAQGETTWKPLSMCPEFASAFPAAPAPATISALAADDGRARALSLVSGPAIALIVVTAVGIALAVLGIFMQLLGIGMAGMNMNNFQGVQNPDAARLIQMFSGGLGIVIKVIGIAVGLFIIYGGVKMKRLENHSLALAAAIIAMIPCLSPCCCLGLPIGIWAVVVLNKPEVKQYFT
jgi:hypothetical protein